MHASCQGRAQYDLGRGQQVREEIAAIERSDPEKARECRAHATLRGGQRTGEWS